jgi:hypothetical protein
MTALCSRRAGAGAVLGLVLLSTVVWMNQQSGLEDQATYPVFWHTRAILLAPDQLDVAVETHIQLHQYTNRTGIKEWDGWAHFVRSDSRNRKWHTIVERGSALDMWYYFGVQWPGDTMIRMAYCKLYRADPATFWPGVNASDATWMARLLWPMSEVLPTGLRTTSATMPLSLPWNRPLRDLCAQEPPVVEMAVPLRRPQTLVKAASRQKTTFSSQAVEPCLPDMRGNGICDDVCNNKQSAWDGGDCCRATRKGDDDDEDEEPVVGAVSSCKDGPYILFLHGANWPVNNTDDWSAQFSDVQPSIVDEVVRELRIWGRLPFVLRDWTRNMIFNLHDATHYNWSHPRLQRVYYDKAHDVIHKHNGIVVAPAFASMVLAGACLDQGLCDVSWYAVAVPWRGTPIVDLAYLPDHTTTMPQPMSEATRSLSPLYRNLSTDDSLLQVVQRHGLVRASLCGHTAFGTGGDAGLQLASLAAQVQARRPWQQDTDGMTPLQDCIDASVASVSVVDGNHHDVVGMLADEWSGGAIVAWYRNILRK